ncbi:MAG: hypothetical protein K2X03_15690 [Bryobacteraceae bacterium]|nr:hypothetical protein [Bryobacteraceae bacterium]
MTSSPGTPAKGPAEAGRLDSWKQIAAYLDKSERTVRRWQETEGLPVHKHQHQQRGSVWAYQSELDEWLAQRRISPEPLVEEPSEEPAVPPRQIPWKPMAAVVGLAAAAIAGWIFTHRPPEPLAAAVPFTSMLSVEYGATFSPDGQQAAFFWGAKGKSGIYVKSLQSDEAKPLVVGPSEEGFTYSPAWSPDGKTIAFLRRTPNQETWLCLVSPAGGPERKLLRLATTFAAFWADHQHLSWGPDSQWLLAPIAASAKSQAIHRISVNGGSERLTDAAGTSAFSPALSPDARSFVFLRRAGDSMTTYELMRQELIADRPPEVVYRGKGSSAGVAWLPNGQDLVFCTQNSQAAADRETWLYRLPARPGATLTPLGIKNCNTVAVSMASAALLYGSVASETTTLWQASLNALDSPAEFAPSSRYDAFPSFSPDGRSLAFVSNRSGEHEVWLVGADGNGARRVTEHAQARGGPHWSPDGSRLVFGALLGAGPDLPPGLATAPIAGGSAQAISLGGQLAHEPVWSRDGKRIYYSSGLQIWRSTADGRDRVKLLDGSRYQALGESSDGRMLYYTKRSQHYLLCRLPLGGGPEEIVADGLWVGAATLTSQALYFVRGSDKSLYRLPFDRQAATGLGPERKLGVLLGENQRPAIQSGMAGLTVSPDDTRIIWSVRREPQIDLALIRDIH